MQIKSERDYKVRDRNALISLVLGVVVLLLAGFAAGGTSDGSGTAALIFGLLGLVLVVNGYFFYKRR